MSFEACFQCGTHTTDRKEEHPCREREDHEIYSYDWLEDVPDKLEALEKVEVDAEQ